MATKVTQDEIAGTTLGYAAVTATQGSITAETDLTGLSVTVTVPAGGRKVKITGYAPFNNNTANATSLLFINKDGSDVQLAHVLGTATAANTNVGTVIYVDTPTAGSHTYKLRGQAAAGTTSIVPSAGQPAFILVELI